MQLNNQNILFFTRSMEMGGTEKVILQLCEVFRPIVNKIVVCSKNGIHVATLSDLGIKHYSIPDIEDKSPGTIITVSKMLKKIIRDEKITVIHTHHRMAAFYVRILGLNRFCTIINTSHNVFLNRRILTRFSYQKSHLIACGNSVKNNLEDFYKLKDVKVICNAVKNDYSYHEVSSLKEEKNKGNFLIGNIGRLSQQKGMDYYLKAIPYVIEKHPNTIFYVIGTGEDEKKLKDMGKSLPVFFLGYRNDIQNVMSQLDLVVLSSLWEGLPLTPIEAFSVGKTIVATDIEGTNEIVKDKINGLLVEPKNSTDLAEKINWMIEHSEEKKVLEEGAMTTYEKNFSYNAFAKEYIDYYRSL